MDLYVHILVARPVGRMTFRNADVAAPRAHVVAMHEAVETRRVVDPLHLVRFGVPRPGRHLTVGLRQLLHVPAPAPIVLPLAYVTHSALTLGASRVARLCAGRDRCCDVRGGPLWRTAWPSPLSQKCSSTARAGK